MEPAALAGLSPADRHALFLLGNLDLLGLVPLGEALAPDHHRHRAAPAVQAALDAP